MMSYIINSTCKGCTSCVKVCPVHAITGTVKSQHTIDSKACIECCACGKICRFNSIIDEKGNVYTPQEKASWEKPNFDLEECCGCRQCEIACPVSCIDLKLQLKKDGTLYPFLKNEKECISCGFCFESCPVAAIQMK